METMIFALAVFFVVMILIVGIFAFIYFISKAVIKRNEKSALIALIMLGLVIIIPKLFSLGEKQSTQKLLMVEQNIFQDNIYVIKNDDQVKITTGEGTIEISEMCEVVDIYETENVKEPIVRVTTYILSSSNLNPFYQTKYEIFVPKGSVFVVQ
ncbi:MAG: hypothetical protein Q4G05_00640 [Clostridia bacterium]|nr:hypothetical protein [Clostridia bacterium]